MPFPNNGGCRGILDRSYNEKQSRVVAAGYCDEFHISIIYPSLVIISSEIESGDKRKRHWGETKHAWAKKKGPAAKLRQGLKG